MRHVFSFNATAIGAAVFLSEGIFFVRGFFVNVPKQTLIVDYYTNTPSYRVGLTIEENILTSKAILVFMIMQRGLWKL